jgi:hypothetical protein
MHSNNPAKNVKENNVYKNTAQKYPRLWQQALKSILINGLIYDNHNVLDF